MVTRLQFGFQIPIWLPDYNLFTRLLFGYQIAIGYQTIMWFLNYDWVKPNVFLVMTKCLHK